MVLLGLTLLQRSATAPVALLLPVAARTYFDDCLGLLIPGVPPGSFDLVEFNEFRARAAAEDGDERWEPYRLRPAPGGLLQWRARSS